MKKVTSKLAVLTSIALISTSSWGTVIFGDGGTALTGVLNNITVDPSTGTDPGNTFNADIDVVNNQLSPDEVWAITGTGGSVSTMIIELAALHQ